MQEVESPNPVVVILENGNQTNDNQLSGRNDDEINIAYSDSYKQDNGVSTFMVVLITVLSMLVVVGVVVLIILVLKLKK